MTSNLKARTHAVKRAVNVVKSDLANIRMVAEAVNAGATDPAEGKRQARRFLDHARESLLGVELSVAALDGVDPTPPGAAAARAPAGDPDDYAEPGFHPASDAA